MDQVNSTLPVTSPVSNEKHNSDVKRTDSSSSEQAYMFDKMTKVEEATYEANESQDNKSSMKARPSFYQKYRKYIHLVMWLCYTAFLCAAYALQIPKGYSQELLILGLIYVYFTLFLFFCYVPTTIITKPWGYCIDTISDFICSRLAPKKRSILYAILVSIIIIATIFSFPEKEESPRLRRLISLLGLYSFLAFTFAASVHRRHVKWNTISSAILIQFLLALFVFRSSVGHDIFNWIANFAEGFLHNAWYGAQFVFGDAAANSGVFAINVFPAIIFFASTVQILYYIGAIQWLLRKMSVICIKVLGITGAESIVAIASPFLGQSENALLIEPLIKDLTKSEIHQILTCGFATISGSVLYGYIAMGVSGQALLTSCIMSIPCSIAVSKLRYPETEESMTKNGTDVLDHAAGESANILHAAGKGAEVGIHIVFLIMANLISLLAILYAANSLLTWIGDFLNIQNLTLQFITGYIFVPVAWLIGADNADLVIVGRLLATKIWANEFVAYQDLTTTYKGVLSARSELVTVYALCGFANLSSIGIQVGVLGALAPKRAGEISQLAISAFICGAMSTWISASIAGMLI
ncbi:Na+ dependent nucleoside transporter C-terminus-domain-containing protein [Thamnidium elegans]|nr:Na+ dependent nucleoside transporter C-terminus-domain-containing protein [Thamnidium elegans]